VRCRLAIAMAALLPLTAMAQSPTPDTAANPLAQARQAYAERADPGRAKEAMDLFLQAAAADPQSYEARWEGARAIYYLGTYGSPKASDDDKVVLFQRGIDLAKAAIALRPEGVEGHFWLGVLYGVYGEARGVMKSLGLVGDIEREMELCLKEDPSVEGYGPYRVLGRMYYKLPWFAGGSKKKSLEYLEKSLAGAPTNDLTRLYLADTLRAKGRDEEAKAQLQHILSTPPDPRWAPEYPWIKGQAEQLAKEMR
jgi:tetratricopeptide (TPR) repeat protein